MTGARKNALLVLLVAGLASGCASTKAQKEGTDPNLITREQILATSATNLHDVVSRLRPQWLRAPAATSFSMNNEIVVFQDQMQLGGPDALRQLSPEIAHEVRYLDGVRAATMLPGLMSGRHIAGVIVVATKPPAD